MFCFRPSTLSGSERIWIWIPDWSACVCRCGRARSDRDDRHGRPSSQRVRSSPNQQHPSDSSPFSVLSSLGSTARMASAQPYRALPIVPPSVDRPLQQAFVLRLSEDSLEALRELIRAGNAAEGIELELGGGETVSLLGCLAYERPGGSGRASWRAGSCTGWGTRRRTRARSHRRRRLRHSASCGQEVSLAESMSIQTLILSSAVRRAACCEGRVVVGRGCCRLDGAHVQAHLPSLEDGQPVQETHR